MAILWERSIVPWLGETGAPYSGAKVYFFDDGTTTPMITYTDPSLSIPHDHPVVANSAGMFPAIFLEEQVVYKFRVTDADDVLISEVDGVSSPTTTPPEIPDSDTPVEKIFQTGDLKMAWRVDAPTGWVRMNGRTIGAAASGAAERANTDCEDLFIFLWNKDSNLAVSGGRGATANGDWAANKTIALPDPRGSALVILDSFGNSAAGRVTDAILGADSDTLGTRGGSQTHTLVTGEIPAHGHSVTGTTNTTGAHAHGVYRQNNEGGSIAVRDGGNSTSNTTNTTSAGDHSHTVTGTAADTGGGGAHNNLQPTIMVAVFIKL